MPQPSVKLLGVTIDRVKILSVYKQAFQISRMSA